MSRDPMDLTHDCWVKFAAFSAAMDKAGIPWICTYTRRTLEEQKALYAQGRTTPGKIVTWTMKSRHLDGEAFDIVLLKDGKANWDTKDPDWTKAGEIGESVGLKWGGRFKTPDMPHFELAS